MQLQLDDSVAEARRHRQRAKWLAAEVAAFRGRIAGEHPDCNLCSCMPAGSLPFCNMGILYHVCSMLTEDARVSAGLSP